MLSKRKVIGDYTIGKTIGQGAFSKVKIAYNKVTKEEVAIKIINKKQLEIKNKKTQENKELYKKKREQEELKKKKAVENAVIRCSAPKIDCEHLTPINPEDLKNKYCKIPSFKKPEDVNVKVSDEKDDNASTTATTENAEVDANNTNSNTTTDNNISNNHSSTSSSHDPLNVRKHNHNPSIIMEESENEEINEELNFNPPLGKHENKKDNTASDTTNTDVNDTIDESDENAENDESIIKTDDSSKANDNNEIDESIKTDDNDKIDDNTNENIDNIIIDAPPSNDQEKNETDQDKLQENNNDITSHEEEEDKDKIDINTKFHKRTGSYEPLHLNRKFSVDSNNQSTHSKVSFTTDRRFSLDSNVTYHTVNDTADVCTPLKDIENGSSNDSEEKDKSVFLTDHSVIPLPSYYERLQNEVQLMMRLDHPNIIKIYQVIESEEETLIVMEYAPGGELIDYILSKKHLNESEARRFFRQIISAIDHCHMANVVHRDLKLENLLLSKDKNILITDFGLGRTFDGSTKDYMTTFCGTPNYAAIELISGIPYIGVKSDIWALGVILYVMMTGKPPFDGKSINALYRRIKRIDYKVPSYFSKDLSNLLAKIFVRDPEKRASINDLREDAWVNYEEIEKPLRIFPINAQDMQQIVSGITNGNGYISYIFREPSCSPAKKKESTMNLSMAISQNNINDCQLLTNERRKSTIYDDIKRRLNVSTAAKSPVTPSESIKSPFRNMTTCEIPNMDVWGGVLVDSSFSNKMRNKVYSSVMETGSNGLGGSCNLKSNDNYHSTTDICRTSSQMAANRHYLRLNTNLTNSPSLINSAIDEHANLNPRYYSIVNISEKLGNSDDSIHDSKGEIAPLKSNSKSVSQITDSSLYNTTPNSKYNGKVNRVKSEYRSNKSIQRSSSYGISNFLSKRKNKVENINIVNGSNNDSSPSPLKSNYSSPLSPHKRATSAINIRGQGNSLTNNNIPSSVPKPLCNESRKISLSVASPLYIKTDKNPTEVFNDEFESSSDVTSPVDACVPNYQEIEMWHLIHKPSKVVRSTRLTFNKATISSKPPFSLFQNLCWAMYEMKNVYANRFYFIRNPDYYLFECHLLSEDLNSIIVKFEVEVCKVWLLKLYTLRFKRIVGSSFLYEELYNELLSLLKSDEEANNAVKSNVGTPVSENPDEISSPEIVDGAIDADKSNSLELSFIII